MEHYDQSVSDRALNTSRRCRGVIGICAGLAVLVFIVFGQTVGYKFIDYDDGLYVFENAEVIKGLTPHGVAQAFTHKEIGLWNPLVTISHMLDCQFYGLNAGGHHLTNVLLHLASAILLFLILLQMTGALWRSAFVAAVFAIHPLNVESVAWVSERKDVLSGLFFMLTLGAYLHYVRRPHSVGRYIGVIVLFGMGLMCKPMLVTLPFVLLLLDYWPLNRLFQPSPGRNVNWRAVVEKVLMLALSLALCVGTMLGPKATSSIAQVPFWTRMGEAPAWVVTYLGQMIWPAGLAVVYTHPEKSLSWLPLTLALCGSLSLAVFLLRGKYPYLWMGWLWNLGMLAPVSGIVQISRHARADHYNYLPQIGLYIGLTWVAADLAGEWRHRRVALGGMAAAILCGLLVAAYHQTACWRDSITLWTHTIGCTRDNYTAQTNLGYALSQQGQTEEAIAHYRASLQITSNYPETHNDLGAALIKQGQTEEAIAQYQEALRIDPAFSQAHYNLGLALFQQGRVDDAISEFHEALRINPTLAEAHDDLATALLFQGRTEDAIAHYREALQINPATSRFHYNFGNALARQGRMGEATAEYREAIRINPADALAHNNLGKALCQQGRADEGISHYREALQINPADAMVHNNLGKALAQQGRMDEGSAQFREAVRLNPTLADAHYNLALALLQQGQTQEAIEQDQKALDLQPANVPFQNNLAWMLATAPQASLRNGAKALELAMKASQASGGSDPSILDTLAAAYAEAGKFPEAVQAARKALQLAEARSNARLAAALNREIKLYEAGHSYEDAR